MKNIWIGIAFTGIVVMIGCKAKTPKDAAIATDMCGCFNLLRDSLPADAIKIFNDASLAEKPQESFTNGMQQLNPETAVKVNEALMLTAKAGSPVSDCLKELDKKYPTQTASNQQEMAKKMIDELKDRKGCEIMMALLRMNLKQ